MAIQQQPLDWARLNHIGTRITWEDATYQHFKDQASTNTAPAASGMGWIYLPFESVHLDKLPELSGIYAFSYTYRCLGFPEQQIIMYVGETGNLRDRLKQHMGTAEGTHEGNQAARPDPHADRLRYLFSTFQNLTMIYHTLNVTQDERWDLERNLINLLDPPFNWKHRPRPGTAPTIGRPGKILTNPRAAAPAFGQQNPRRIR